MKIIQKSDINPKIRNIYTDFNYTQFFTAQNQEQYLKNYMYKKTNLETEQENKYFILKLLMRNIDWQRIAKSGMLQENFIVSQFSISQLVENKIIKNDEYQINYFPIKIFTYLPADHLCKYNNLSKNYEIILSSDSSNDSDNFTIESQQFYQYYVDFINKDKKDYIQNTNKIYPDKENYKINDVHRYDFLQNNVINNDYINKSKYSRRFYDIDSNSSFDDNSSNSSENTKNSLQFFTYDKKYMGEITYNINVISSNSFISTSSITTEYITNSIRYVGIDKKELIKNQKLNLKFIVQHYTMYDICKYYKFTEEELNDNKYGLILNNDNEITKYNFEILFKYQNFDTTKASFKQFINSNITNINNTAKYNFCLYQTFDLNDSTYNQFLTQIKNKFIINDDYKNELSQILAISALQSDDLFEYNVKFHQNDLLNSVYIEKIYYPSSSSISASSWFLGTKQSNYGDIKSLVNINNTDMSRKFTYNDYTYHFIKNISQDNNAIVKYSDNVIITNCKVEDKIRMICALTTNEENYIYYIKTDGYYIGEYNNSDLNKKDINQELRENLSYQHNDFLQTYPIINAYYDNNGYYIKLWTQKYKNYQCGKKEVDSDTLEYFSQQCYFKFGKNICNLNYFNNKNYYIVGRKDLLNCNKNNLIQVKVYFKDIMAILDNKCLAAKIVYVDNAEALE